MNLISFNLLKIWVCAPIVFNKRGIEKLVKEKIPNYNRFALLHYYQSLFYAFEKIVYLDRENSFENNYLCSQEAIDEMNAKFNTITTLYEKNDVLKNKRYRLRNYLIQSILDTFSNSVKFDIFNKYTSFEMIDYITKVLCSYVKILSRGEVKKYTQILSLFEFFIDLESFLFNLNSKDSKFIQIKNKNYKFKRDYEKTLYLVSSRVDFINSLIVTKKIIPSFGEKVKVRIKEFMMSI